MVYDDILNKKILRHLGERNLTLPRNDMVRKKERYIMNVI
jgi:hypothetical protein